MTFLIVHAYYFVESGHSILELHNLGEVPVFAEKDWPAHMLAFINTPKALYALYVEFQVESIIGASVPSILAYDDADDVTSTPSIGERQLGPAALGTDGASAVLPGGGSLWSRTVRGQVQ